MSTYYDLGEWMPCRLGLCIHRAHRTARSVSVIGPSEESTQEVPPHTDQDGKRGPAHATQRPTRGRATAPATPTTDRNEADRPSR